jgi:hypothetical protein
LVFSGDTDAFEVIGTDVSTRTTPFQCDSGQDYTVSFDDGETRDVVLGTKFTDGTEKTMTVTVYDIDGSVVDTVDARATTQDPVIAEAVTNPSLLGVWVIGSSYNGTISHSTDVLQDESSTSAAVFRANLEGLGGDWSFDPADSPGSVGVLTRGCIVSPDGTRSTIDYAALTTALADDSLSGMVIFRQVDVQGTNQRFNVFTPNGLHNTAMINNWQWMWHEVGITSDRGNGFGPAVVHSDRTTWMAHCWKPGAGDNTKHWLMEIGQTWNHLGSAEQHDNQLTWDPSDKGASFFRTGGAQFPDTGDGEVRMAMIVLFSADIGETKLRDLYEAIVA